MTTASPAKIEKKAEKGEVPAVRRACALLRVLAQSEEPRGVVSLAREIDVIPSTCLHILRVLVDHELARFDGSTKHYSLGPGILALSSGFSQHNLFAHLARPFLDKLSRDNQIAFAAIERSDAEHLVVVAVGDLVDGMAVRLRTGVRLPTTVSASGRCFAAYGDISEAELRKKFVGVRWDDPPAIDDWLEQIRQTRQQGFAIDPGNYIRGISVIAVPVFFEHNILAGCLTGVDFKDRLVDDRLTKVVGAMQKAAEALSDILGGSQ